jgi:hypothetical protein
LGALREDSAAFLEDVVEFQELSDANSRSFVFPLGLNSLGFSAINNTCLRSISVWLG